MLPHNDEKRHYDKRKETMVWEKTQQDVTITHINEKHKARNKVHEIYVI